MTHRLILVLLVLLFVVACQRPTDQARCADMGFVPGSPAMANCRLQLESNRRAAGLAMVGIMRSRPQPTYFPRLPSRHASSTSYWPSLICSRTAQTLTCD